jgi:hypothetical protein
LQYAAAAFGNARMDIVENLLRAFEKYHTAETKAQYERQTARTVNRRAKLTLYRRPKLTPL